MTGSSKYHAIRPLVYYSGRLMAVCLLNVQWQIFHAVRRSTQVQQYINIIQKESTTVGTHQMLYKIYLFIELMHIYAPKGGQHVDSTTIHQITVSL